MLSDDLAALLLPKLPRCVAQYCSDEFFYDNSVALQKYKGWHNTNDSYISDNIRGPVPKIHSYEEFLEAYPKARTDFPQEIHSYVQSHTSENINWCFLAKFFGGLDLSELYNDYTYKTSIAQVQFFNCGNPDKYCEYYNLKAKIWQWNPRLSGAIYKRYQHLFTDEIQNYYKFKFGTYKELLPLTKNMPWVDTIFPALLLNTNLRDSERYAILKPYFD